MTTAQLLPLPVVLPLSGAVLAPLAARLHRRLALVVGLVAVLAALGVLIGVASTVYAGNGHVLTHFLSNEHPVHGYALGIAFAADPFGLAFALLTTVLGAVLLLYALSELGDLGPKEQGGLAALTLLLLAALVGAALTADAVNLFVWFEVAAIASYGLTGFFLERPIALEAAFKNAVLTSTAGFLVFGGSAMLYVTSGALNLGQLHVALGGHLDRAQLVAVAMLVAGFATKAGLVPFHAWLPDTHTPVPGPVSALFSALMVDLGVVGLVRLTLLVVPGTVRLHGVLLTLGMTSAVVGALLALVQQDLKRLLAWDTVSQMGVLVAGFASGTPDGVAGATYHLISHGFFKALLFLCAGAVVHATGLTRLDELGGLLRRRPLLAGGFVVGCLAIAGVPPLSGYASLALIHEGLHDQPFAYAVALAAQVLTVAGLGRAAWLGFLRPRAEAYEHLEPLRPGMRTGLGVLATGCLAFGVLPPLVVQRVAAPAASVLLHPSFYAGAVLGGGSVASVPRLPVSFDFADPALLLPSLGEIVGGLALLLLMLRVRRVPWPLRRLRALHTGSVNDYAAYAALGLVAVACGLLI